MKVDDTPPKDVATALTRLKDSERLRKTAALRFLKTAAIEEGRRAEVERALDSMLTALDRPLDAVLYLQLEPQAVKERLGQRHRSDDLEGIVDHRLDVFLDRTAPLIRYYNDQGKLKVIDGARPPEEVAASIEEVIQALAGSDNGSRRTPSRS